MKRKKKKIVLTMRDPLDYFKAIRKPIPPSTSHMGDDKKNQRKKFCREKNDYDN